MSFKADRLTGNEREVLVNALQAYRSQLLARERRSVSPLVKSDCQWRAVVVQQLLANVYER